MKNQKPEKSLLSEQSFNNLITGLNLEKYKEANPEFANQIDKLNMQFYNETEKFLSLKDAMNSTQDNIFMILFKQIALYNEELLRVSTRTANEEIAKLRSKVKSLEGNEQRLKKEVETLRKVPETAIKKKEEPKETKSKETKKIFINMDELDKKSEMSNTFGKLDKKITNVKKTKNIKISLVADEDEPLVVMNKPNSDVPRDFLDKSKNSQQSDDFTRIADEFKEMDYLEKSLLALKAMCENMA